MYRVYIQMCVSTLLQFKNKSKNDNSDAYMRLYIYLFYFYIQQAGINITFTGNTAWFGSAIYISSITACSWTGNTQPYFDRSYFPKWPIFFIRYI